MGLVLYVGRRIGGDLEDRRDYRRFPRPGQLERAARRAGLIEVAADDARPGDVVLLRTGRIVRHAGILSDRGLIHACGRRGVVVEHGLNRTWRRDVSHVFSFPCYMEHL